MKEWIDDWKATIGWITPGTVDKTYQDFFRMTPPDVNLIIYTTPWALRMLHPGTFDKEAFRAQREGVLGRTGNVEEVRLRAGREHEDVTLDGLPLGGAHGVRRGIDLGDPGELHVDVGMLVKCRAQRGRDLGCRQLRRCDLVEEGLELVIVVLVDQGDVHPILAGQCSCAAETGKPAAHDHDMLRRGH